MRSLLLLAAAVLAAPAAAADLPAVVLHVKPVGSLIEDIRAGAKLVGGPDVLKQFDAEMKKALGEKGFAGIDLTRPVVGYAYIADTAEKLETVPFVFAVPITSEEAFLDLIARANQGMGKAEPVPGKKGLFKLPAPRPINPARAKDSASGDENVMRFHGTHAYLTQESNAAALEPAALVPAEKLAMPGETALVAVRITFDRFPESVRKKFADGIESALQEIKTKPLPVGEIPNKEFAEQAEKKFREMFTRYLNQAKEANEATVRWVFDARSGETGVEFGLSAKPGTSLAADIAGRKPNTNRFAGLVGPESAVGLRFTTPLFGQEGRELIAFALESGAKEGLGPDAPEAARTLIKEAFEGVGRTIRAGSLDVAAALNGPEKGGTFTAVAAVSFEDPSKVEAELRKVVKEMAPPEVQDLIKWDAGKAGAVNIHVVKPPPGQLPPQVQQLFGESAQIGLAFAPKGIYVAFGPDPVAALKAALAQPPREARVLDLVVNPSRLGKLAGVLDGDDALKKVIEMIGDRNELYSVLFVDFEGGTELRARIGVNLKLAAGIVPRAIDRHAPEAAEKK